MKRLIYVLLASFTIFLGSCENETLEVAEDTTIETTDQITTNFTNNTRMMVMSAGRYNPPSIPTTQEADAYYYLRIDGDIVDRTETMKANEYWPNNNGSSAMFDYNKGTVYINQNNFHRTSDELVLNDGIDVNSLLGTLPNIGKMLKESPIVYDESNYTVEWYAIKKHDGNESWNVDGVVKSDPKFIIEIPFDEDLYIEADDFAIRRDGVYMDSIVPVNNTVNKAGIIAHDGVKISINQLNQLDFNTYREYTYEVWLWAKRITSDFNNQDIEMSGTTGINIASGYKYRLNVFRGVAGQNDTPYMKVSIHLNKQQ